MTGDKPDPRLRTPMQWSAGPRCRVHHRTPWESAQPDSATINVAKEEAEPGSLLNLYRRLIHLRRTNDALATGRLVPLTTGNPQVVAYLRRAGDHAVLVVANLGAHAGVTDICDRFGNGARAAGTLYRRGACSAGRTAPPCRWARMGASTATFPAGTARAAGEPGARLGARAREPQRSAISCQPTSRCCADG